MLYDDKKITDALKKILILRYEDKLEFEEQIILLKSLIGTAVLDYKESNRVQPEVSLQLPDAIEMASKRLEKERGKNIELWVDGEQTDYWKEVYCLGVMDERERQLSN